MKGRWNMEYEKSFEDLTVDESLTIDAGAFASASLIKSPKIVPCYGIYIPSIPSIPIIPAIPIKRLF